MAKTYPQYEVEWEDSYSSYQWQEINSCINEEKPSICRSTGYLLKSGRKYLLLALNISDIGNCSNRVIIPRSAIRGIWPLERKPK
ncbi:hypothetical protein LCGC14_1741370 [marine sediment metagenome]|uniref:Uncharacterized protein n=1 Tax=marine sediment metagenome TaxID=412755 RepID=A0A0F9K6A5_9ZZZZ